MNASVRWFLPELTVAALLGIAYGIGGPVGSYGGLVKGIATLGSFALVPAVRRSGRDWRQAVRWLFGLSAAIGVVSIATGLGNYATDEPFTMNAYLNVLLSGHDPYTTAANVTFTASVLGHWSHTVSAPFHYVYLPLLLFFQVPGTGVVGYEAVCLAGWMGIVYLVRANEVASLCLVSPMAALVAANGFTDLPVLFLATLALVVRSGPGARAAEYATYAMKQFANVFWFALYVGRRDFPRAAFVLALTLLFAAPFILWHPNGIWCEALTFSASPGCAGTPNSSRQLSDLYSHWNYYLWVLWVGALYYRPLLRGGRRVLERARVALRPRPTGA